MTDLRTRIASAIYEASDEYTRKLMVNPRLPGCADVQGDRKPVTYVLADAVIAELGLEEERGGTYEVGGEATSHRYVTDWEPDRQPRSAEKLGLTGDGT
jgi:hypothetical protein